MRPLQLIMNAFGPYREKVDLDFTKFGASSIYLISGPTGAGKTTIFDGISYALYNKASGSVRDVDMLKSHFATDEDLCYVDLTFEMGPVTYRIKRSPKQKAPGVRGNPIDHQRDVAFYKEGQLIETGTAADQAIEELLGLTYEQFRQIVLLPQGEFRKLLLSNSGEKEDIFRNIFGTETIQKFQENLRLQARELKKTYEEYGTRLDQSLMHIETVENERLAAAIAKADYEEILERLGECLEDSSQELAKNRREIEQLEQTERKNEQLLRLLTEEAALTAKKKELAETEAHIQKLQTALAWNVKARAVKVEQEKLSELESEGFTLDKQSIQKQEALSAMSEELETLFEKQKKSKKAESELEDIREAIKRLERELGVFEECERQAAKVKAAEKELDEATAKMTDLEKNGEIYAEEMKGLAENLGKLSEKRVQLDGSRKAVPVVQAAFEKNQQEKRIFEKLLGWQKSLAEKLTADKKLSAELQKAQRQYEKANQTYFGNLAGVLAAELTEDEPCPVCGSIHHPNPAEASADNLSKEQLAEYESAKNQAQTAHTELAAEIRQIGELIEEQKILLGHFDGDYAQGLAATAEKEEAFEAEMQELESEIQTLEEFLKQEEGWRKKLEKTQEANQQNTLDLQQEMNKQQSALKQINECKTNVKDLEKQLTHTSAQEAEKEIEQKTRKIQVIQEEAAYIQKELAEKENEQTKIETSLAMLQEQNRQNTEKTRKQKAIFDECLKDAAFDLDYENYLLEKKQVEVYQEEIQVYEEETVYTTRKLAQINEELTTYEKRPLLSDLEEELAEIKKMKQEFESQRDERIRKTSLYERSHADIHENYEKSKEILKPLKIYQELAEVANGSTKRTSYVSFERYVLSIYFSEILSAANQRFEKMTNNRFELVRREEKTKGRGADGLEVDVLDRHSGRRRSAGTLSGGETFKASLALALGLSDVIQNQQGGIRVDTLFIDEGFGTLDANSLENAIETLMDLQATGRLIGIISHVNELKDRVPAKILVENKQSGSHARILVD